MQKVKKFIYLRKVKYISEGVMLLNSFYKIASKIYLLLPTR